MPLVTTDTLRAFIEDCRVRRQIAWNLDYPTEVEMESRRINAAQRACRLMQIVSNQVEPA